MFTPIFRGARSPARFPLHAIGLAIAAALLEASAAAQTAAPTSSPTEIRTLPEVVVTANPLKSDAVINPTQVMQGDELLQKGQSTLGETLNTTPGVSSSYFGPNASRPIVRGLSGDRIVILQNSGTSPDASGLSDDHAVTTDPSTLERIEVVRGPAALLYGGSAVGGVINLIDNRIPDNPLFDEDGGITGKVRLGFGSNNNERLRGLTLETGTDRYALHADTFARDTSYVAVPISLDCSKAGSPAQAKAICNSAASTDGGAVGGSLFFDQGHIGASVSSYRTNYGTVAEDDVTIGMRADRVALEGEAFGLNGWFQTIKGRLVHNEYQHTEFEDGEPGTTFRTAGNNLRLEGRHRSIGPVQGVLGLQLDSNRFSADGDEAFAPYSNTEQRALFALEEWNFDGGRLTFGARREWVDVESMGHPTLDRFVPGSRNFAPASYALGGLWDVSSEWQLTSTVSWSERAPRDYELYANGPHMATGVYLTGLPDAAMERSTNLELGMKWVRGAHSARASVFVNQFSNYLFQQATGATRDTDGNVVASGTPDSLPDYVYRQVGARFHGLEADTRLRLLDKVDTLDLLLRMDWVRAVNVDTGGPLPNIAPLRLGASLLWTRGAWDAQVEANQVAAANDVPSGQLPTGGYTLYNLGLNYRVKTQNTLWRWFARLENAGDTLAYSATSVLTQTVPGKAPLPGRNLKLGLQLQF